MVGEYIFNIEGLSKSYASKTVFKDINLSFYHKAKIGIVGENGAGKSTILRIMAGEEKDYFGTAQPKKGIQIGMLEQEPKLNPENTVRREVESVFGPIQQKLNDYENISESMTQPMSEEKMEKTLEKMGRLQEEIEAVDGWNLKHQVDVAMNALVLPPDDQLVKNLSGGEARRVALCKLLLQKPDILLLDEPTNHLDAETVSWLEDTLKEYPGNVIVVTHDRYFLDNVTKWILELDKGKGIPFEGNYTSWLQQKSKLLDTGDKKSGNLQKRLMKELAWMQLSSLEKHAQSQNRLREIEQLMKQSGKVDTETLDIQVAAGPPLGTQVFKAKNISKSYGDALLFQNVNFDIPRGSIVGLVGPNGVGKTTLFRLLAGEERPDQGELVRGESVVVSYVDQARENLSAEKTVYEEISGGTDFIKIAEKSVSTRQYLTRFNFRGTDQQTPVGKLSGGERNRLHLAKQLLKGANVLLLDEPTNDLDVDTIRSLESALLEFSGSVLVISHDRFFLNRICTHLMVFEGAGKIRWFEGNFEEYQAVRRKELGGRDETRRAKYRKLSLR